MARLSKSLDRIVADIVRTESAAGRTPADVILYAADVTRAATALRGGRLTPARVERYFAAVVRRRLVRSAAGSTAAVNIVVESLVEDLRASGRDDQAIADELERGWADRLPTDVIEQWRSRLCA